MQNSGKLRSLKVGIIRQKSRRSFSGGSYQGVVILLLATCVLLLSSIRADAQIDWRIEVFDDLSGLGLVVISTVTNSSEKPVRIDGFEYGGKEAIGRAPSGRGVHVRKIAWEIKWCGKGPKKSISTPMPFHGVIKPGETVTFVSVIDGFDLMGEFTVQAKFPAEPRKARVNAIDGLLKEKVKIVSRIARVGHIVVKDAEESLELIRPVEETEAD